MMLLIHLLMRLGPWIAAWLIVDEVSDITTAVTGPAGDAGGVAGGVVRASLGLGLLAIAVIAGLFVLRRRL